MKRIAISGLCLVFTAILSACSNSNGSSRADGNNNMTPAFDCQTVVSEILAQNETTPIMLATAAEASAEQHGLSIDQAAKCLDENIRTECSQEICLLQERNNP